MAALNLVKECGVENKQIKVVNKYLGILCYFLLKLLCRCSLRQQVIRDVPCEESVIINTKK